MATIDIVFILSMIGCVVLLILSKDVCEYLAMVFFPCEEDMYNPNIEHHIYGYKPSEEYLETMYLIEDFDFMMLN